MPASFIQIKFDGQELNDLSSGAILGQVVIRQELNQHWWCDIELRQTEDQRFPFENTIGKTLEVSTVDEGGAENTVFKGFVLEADLEYEIFGSFTARILGVTKSYLIDQTPRQRYYLHKTFTDIANRLLGDASLSLEGVTDSTRTLDYVQVGETDFSFLNRLADDVETWMRPTGDGLEFGNAFQDGETLEWRDERGLLRFRAKGRVTHDCCMGAQYDAVHMQSKVWDKVKDVPSFLGSMPQLVDAVKTQSANFPPNYMHRRFRARTLDEFESMMKKEVRRSLGSAITCWGQSCNLDLKPGDKVTISGVLDAEGDYGLIKVVHTWTPDGYQNEFWCTPWTMYTSPKKPDAVPWQGVMPARVVDNNDPNGLGELKVQYYWQEDGPTHWIRMMTPHAGSDRGFLFLPEIGDEVWVYFEDGDPERPRILGAAWNGQDKPPLEDFWGGDMAANDIKRIVTKSGHRIQLVDKGGKESIVIATPKHIKVAMIESTDENGRATLLLHSDGDIVINAGGRIHCKSAFFSREVG